MERTDRHTQDNYCNPRCACAPRVNDLCNGDVIVAVSYCNTHFLIIVIITSRNAKHCGASLSDERVTI